MLKRKDTQLIGIINDIERLITQNYKYLKALILYIKESLIAKSYEL